MTTLPDTTCAIAPGGIHERKRLRLTSLPQGLGFGGVHLDLTLDCNLNCIYCFKTEKEKADIQDRVAFDVALWALHACPVEDRRISFFLMGGEPLLKFGLLKRWLPFLRRRAKQQGVQVSVTMATNCTLVSEEMIAFAKEWDLMPQASIDGVPEVQDFNRPTASGTGSSRLAERGAIRIVEAFPEASLRATVTPRMVSRLHEGYLYFRKLGYSSISMVPSDFTLWDDESIRIYEEQLMKIADAWIADIRGNTWVYLQNIDLFMKGQHTTERPAVSCGAGVGLAAIDIHGDIWPCLRMTKHDRVKWSLGNIYGEFNEELRQRFMDGCPASCIPDECRNCIARCLCGGGCQAENLDCLGDLYTTDPKRCEMARVWTRVGQYARDVLCGEQNRLFLEKYFPQDQRKATPEPSSGPDPAGRASE